MNDPETKRIQSDTRRNLIYIGCMALFIKFALSSWFPAFASSPIGIAEFSPTYCEDQAKKAP